jgi:hypothetical protein
MMTERRSNSGNLNRLAIKLGAIFMLGLVVATARADGSAFYLFLFFPGNLVVSRSVYDNNPNNVTVGESLPPNCTSANCVDATSNGTYPQVFNNALVDGSFGITSKIFLDQITPFGFPLGSLEVPDSPQFAFPFGNNGNHLVTSFSSKSELALNLSTDRRYLTFMGYVATPDTVDVSNANTPGVIDPTNPVPGAYYRAAAQVDPFGQFHFTETNAYSGDNGRAAILNDDANLIYAAGNAGNGSNPEPAGVILGAGAQILSPLFQPEFLQDPGTPTPVGSFNITQLPANKKTDKVGKDTNFRGLTIFNNVVYYTKGSGGNGINTVYFIDTTGAACPGTGVGLPQSGASLPTTGIDYNAAVLQTEGVVPYNMCILNGFNTVLAKTTTNVFPFGVWFANANTLYVADEGDGYAGGLDLDTHAAGQTNAGLQKWVLQSGVWKLAYVLQNNLGLGTPYTVPGYPGGLNLATCVVATGAPNPNNCPVSTTLATAASAPDGLPWAPATDGLRNLTGRVNGDGTVTIYAITSTVSGGGDQGADPNKLVAITDNLAATTLPSSEGFHPVKRAGFAEVLRGVAWTPDQFPQF